MLSNKVSSGFFCIVVSLIVILTGINTQAFGENGKNNKRSNSKNTKQVKLWKQIDESNLKSSNERSSTPDKYLVFRLNQTLLKDSLADLPLEKTEETIEKKVVMEIPMPDGKIQRFRMEETAVLSPELAAQYPTWKTFVGYGIDDPKAVGRFDWTTLGFHGYVETDHGLVYIDPYQKNDTQNYLVYYKHEFGEISNDFYCKVEQDISKVVKTEYETAAPDVSQFTYGGSVRTYRIAIATTGEWSRNAAGYTVGQPVQTTRDNALNVVTTIVNRLNGIYTRELSSSFMLVNPPTNNNATNIIFDNPATDPYNNTDDIPQLALNHTTLDARVGNSNYDIGHLFGTTGGGVANSYTLCYDAQKGRGYSARDLNTTDPFIVDFVAHEIGHQFGADHTYNVSDGAGGVCTTRSATDAFEVASGATIMSYVGFCDNGRNTQKSNDFNLPMFHIRSLTTIIANLTDPGGDPVLTGCGVATGTNAIPTLSAGAAYTIPALTPFTLTATGGDTDVGDVPNLLYSWEEYDLAPSASGAMGTPAGTYDVDTDSVLRPLFRTYTPVAETTRTFPSMHFILNPASNDPAGSNQPQLNYMGTHPTGFSGGICGTNVGFDDNCAIGERLPTVSRTMNFRVTLRDRRGGVIDAGTTVTIAGGAGPFEVTNQNSFAELSPAVTWQANTMQTVTWAVANTNAAPISTANVNILLSTDGGQTFPITLAANTPNDGTEQITVPNNPTTTARIKVEAVGNIFFDINNANFAIMAPTAAAVTVSGRVMSSFGRGISNAIVTSTDQNGVVRTTRTTSFGYYRFNEISAGRTYAFGVKHKSYMFSDRVVSVEDNISGFNFVANN